jgi:hypothetical protein
MRAARPTPATYAGLCLLLCAGLAAGQTPAPTRALPVVPVSDTSAVNNSDEGTTFDNIEIIDASLKGKLSVMRVGSQVADNNLLGVFAGLKNKTGHRLALEVETIYKDKAGNELNASSWIAVTIPANEEKDYRSSAITDQAVDFLIRVRRASSSHK